MEKAERLRKASNLLREKARLTRVISVLKSKTAVCARVEELLISEGELEQDLMSSPRDKTKDSKPDDEPTTVMMIEDGTRVTDMDNELFNGFKMEAHIYTAIPWDSKLVIAIFKFRCGHLLFYKFERNSSLSYFTRGDLD